MGTGLQGTYLETCRIHHPGTTAVASWSSGLSVVHPLQMITKPSAKNHHHNRNKYADKLSGMCTNRFIYLVVKQLNTTRPIEHHMTPYVGY